MADFFIPQPDIGLLLPNQAIPRYFVKPEESDEPLGKTYLGTPFYDQLVFDTQESINANSGTQNSESSLVMQTVLIDVNQVKIIQKTQIAGRNGTIKEYISDDDFRVRIMGAIVSEQPNVYPKDVVRRLINFCKIQDSIIVTSGFLGLFNINQIVIENYSISEKMGSRNQVPFEIYAISDLPIEIQLR